MGENGRGGFRNGSGRKAKAPGEKRVLLTISVSPRTAQTIQDVASALDVNKGVALDRILDEMERAEA